MAVRYPAGLFEGRGGFGDRCAAIPALFLSNGEVESAGAALEEVAASAGEAFIPVSSTDRTPDPLASLWFIRAAHLFGKAGGDPAFHGEKLVPLSRKILQEWIANGMGPVHMADGGVLTVEGQGAGNALRLNGLWYSALETVAADLRARGDRAGDHFERLAGRFRRTFAKAYWCDAHGWICTAEERANGSEAGEGGAAGGNGHQESPGDLPNPEQLLLTRLPASPIPRTKQRQLLTKVRERALGMRGVRVVHPTHGMVESPLYQAWLALGVANAAETPGADAEQAAEILSPLGNLRAQAHTEGLPPFYKEGEPVGGVDPLTTAEVIGAFATLQLAEG